MTVDLREPAPGDYEYLIGRVDDWWGGRSMAPMLPRLFFDHFPATTRIACDGTDGSVLGFVCGFVSQADPHVAYIHFVGVDPVASGRDVGRTLYRWFADAGTDARVHVDLLRHVTGQHRVAGLPRGDGLLREDGRELRRARRGPRGLPPRPHGSLAAEVTTVRS